MNLPFSEFTNYWIKIVALYILSILMICVFLYMDGSAELKEYLRNVNGHSTTSGFKLYVLVGIVQYGLLVAGISIFGTLTFMTLRNK